MLDKIDNIFGYIVSFLESILFIKPMDVIEGIFSFPFIVFILLIGSITFTLYFKFINIRGFRHSIDVIRGKYDNPNDEGEISHFQALTSALSATIGLGNIAGVAVAVSLGGPGAVFWMMFIAVFSMSAKFVSATLGQLYRKVNKDGTINGGPMYYLSLGLKEKKLPLLGKILAAIYAVFIIGGALGGGNMFQANQSFELVANRFEFFQKEPYQDTPNGFWDPGEEFNDCGIDNICIDEALVNNEVSTFKIVIDKDLGEGNGKYDKGEFFNDMPNDKYDDAELFTDSNKNGEWDNTEKFIDANHNKEYDDAETFTDIGNGIWDSGEIYIDLQMKKPTYAEEFIDKNSNNKYDGDILIEGVEGEVCGNQKWDKGELFLDGRTFNYDYYDIGNGSINNFLGEVCTSCTYKDLFTYRLDYDYQLDTYYIDDNYYSQPQGTDYFYYKTELLNGRYDEGEVFFDKCDNKYDDSLDDFIDLNSNNKYDRPESYTDKNNNGFYDYETTYMDISGNIKKNNDEFYFDENSNGQWDCDDEYCEKYYDKLDNIFSEDDIVRHNPKNIHYTITWNGKIFNNSYDSGESFVDIGNGKWDDKSWHSLIYGFILVIIVGLVIIGGISRIAKVTEKIVPVMVLTYVTASLWIILTNINKLPSVISQIFEEAFSPDAIYGGFLGVLIIGVQRAVFSNEGGVGSASIAHSAAKTDEPVREGIVAMIGPFIDTIVICFMTASVILITADINPSYQVGGGINGASLTSDAFGSAIVWFPWILAIVVFLFSYSTMISWYYYGDKGWKYLFGNNKSIRVYQFIYLSCILLGTFASLNNVIGFSDLMILSCAVPNIIGAMFLLPLVKRKLNDYWSRYKSGQFKTYK